MDLIPARGRLRDRSYSSRMAKSSSPATSEYAYRRYLARFNPDGSPDPAFVYSNVVADVSSSYCLALQPDGRILGSGSGRQQLPTSLWRLNVDGTVDGSFTNSLSGSIYGLVLQPDGPIWTGGNFSYLKPSILTNLALVNPTALWIPTCSLVSTARSLPSLHSQMANCWRAEISRW